MQMAYDSFDHGDLGANWVPLTGCDLFVTGADAHVWFIYPNEPLTLGDIRKRHFVFAKVRRAAIAGVVRRIVLEGNQ